LKNKINFAGIYFKSQSRGFANATHLNLTVSSPTYTVCSNKPVKEVTIPGTDGLFTVLANHVPTIAELVPGSVIITDSEGRVEKYFVSGGFAIVNNDSTCSITGVEVIPVDRLDLVLVRKGLEDFERAVSSASNDAQKAEAEVGYLTYKALSYAVTA